MSALPIQQWDPDQFSDLQHILARVLTQPTTSSLRKLHAALVQARPWLLNLTALPGVNDKDKQFVEHSKTIYMLSHIGKMAGGLS